MKPGHPWHLPRQLRVLPRAVLHGNWNCRPGRAWESLGAGLEPLEEPLESCVAREKQQHSPVCLCRGRFRVLAPLPLLFGG